MSYTVQHVDLSDHEMHLLEEMNIPNTDDDTDMTKWIETAKKNADADLANFDDAIGVFLGKKSAREEV